MKKIMYLMMFLLTIFSLNSYANESHQSSSIKRDQAQTLDLVFVLDKSGSMQGYEKDTIGGYNSVLNENRHKNTNTFVTTVLFNDQVDTLLNRKPIKEVKDLTSKDYQASGYTALYDAVGDTITQFSKESADNVLFVIITDGEENSSKRYTAAKIRAMITQAEKDKKWDFIFIGANINVEKEAKNIGIKANKAASYSQDKQGYEAVFDSVNQAVEMKNKAQPLSSPQWKSSIEKDNHKRQ